MSENTLHGDDWFAKLKNPQNAPMDTARAEGGQSIPATPVAADVDPQ